MNRSILLLGVCSLSLLGACSKPPVADSPANTVQTIPATGDAASIQATIDEAQAKLLEARQLQHAWSSTAELLQSANTALQNGDLESARTDSKRALLTANASLAQAKKQQATWRNNIPG
jgi:hypothetical protein